jgi:hypothetical protein
MLLGVSLFILVDGIFKGMNLAMRHSPILASGINAILHETQIIATGDDSSTFLYTYRCQ